MTELFTKLKSTNQQVIPLEISKNTHIKNSKQFNPHEISPQLENSLEMFFGPSYRSYMNLKNQNDLHEWENTTVNSGIRTIKEAMILSFLTIKGVKDIPLVFESQSEYKQVALSDNKDAGFLFSHMEIEEIIGTDWENFQFTNAQDLITSTLAAAKILNQIYKLGFLHNDISPSNIMKRENGSIVIIDFNNTERMDKHGFIYAKFGTHGFSAPEKYPDINNAKKPNFKGAKCDVRSDIYSLILTMTSKLNIDTDIFYNEKLDLKDRRTKFIDQVENLQKNNIINDKIALLILTNTNVNPDKRAANYDELFQQLTDAIDDKKDFDTFALSLSKT